MCGWLYVGTPNVRFIGALVTDAWLDREQRDVWSSLSESTVRNILETRF